MLELDTTGQFTRSEYLRIEELGEKLGEDPEEGFLVTMFVDEREEHGYYDPDLIHYVSTIIDREQAKELLEYLKVKLNEKEN